WNLKGPVPTGDRPNLSPRSRTACGLTIMARGSVRLSRNGAKGSFSLMVTVKSPTAWTSATGPNSEPAMGDLVSGESARSIEALTAWALNGLPSWNFTSLRSWNVQVRPSPDTLQERASAG